MPQSPAETITELYAAFNAGDLDRLRELIHPDAVIHLPGTAADAEHPPGAPRDRDGWLRVWQMTNHVFPDTRAEVEQMLVDGDMVATRCLTRGTHTVAFMGVPPTGRAFTMPMLNMTRVVDGQVVEHWTISDNVTMLAQLGIKPPM